MKIRPTHCATAAALMLATGLGTTAAHAISVTPSAPCDTTLTDAGSNTWPIDPISAFVIKGQDRITQVTAQEVGTGYWTSFQNTSGIGCTAELDGRQITFPEAPTIIAGVVLSRKLYTPPTGSGAIRLLDTFRNTTDAPVTFVARTDRQSYYSMELPMITATSSGDTSVTVDDNWDVVSTQTGVTHSDIWQGNTAPHRADEIYGGSLGTQQRWTVTVPANSSISLVEFATQRPTDDAGRLAAAADAALIAAAAPSDAIFGGLTTEERARIINFDAVLPPVVTPPAVATLRVRPTISRSAFLAGMPISVNCSSACTTRIRLVARATSEGRLMATHGVLLDEVTKKLGTTSTAMKLYPAKRLVISRTAFTAYVKITVTDANGNTTTTSAPVRVS